MASIEKETHATSQFLILSAFFNGKKTSAI
jgi:hypothetical protein